MTKRLLILFSIIAVSVFALDIQILASKSESIIVSNTVGACHMEAGHRIYSSHVIGGNGKSYYPASIYVIDSEKDLGSNHEVCEVFIESANRIVRSVNKQDMLLQPGQTYILKNQ